MLASRLLNPDDEENGWYLRDMIIWNKVTAGRSGAGNRFGQFIKIPVPTRYRANIMHEQIIILQKGKDGRRLDKETEPKVPINRAMKRQVANSIWDITPVPPNAVKHPAPFPEQIPWRLISLYTEKGDVVLDPMCGSGQTTKVAKSLGRKYVGVDLRKEYVSLSKKRLKGKANAFKLYHSALLSASGGTTASSLEESRMRILTSRKVFQGDSKCSFKKYQQTSKTEPIQLKSIIKTRQATILQA